MPEIKTREVVKGTVKTLDRAAVAGERMKQAYIKTRKTAEQSAAPSESSPEEYASEQLTGSVDNLTREAVHHADRQTHQFIQGQKEHRRQKAKSQPKKDTTQDDTPNDTPQAENDPHQNPGGDTPSEESTAAPRPEASSHPGENPSPEAVRERQVTAAKKAFQEKRGKQAAARTYAHDVPVPSGSEAPPIEGAAQPQSAPRTIRTRHGASQAPAGSIRTVERTTGTIRQKAVSAGTATVKSADRSIRTAEHSIKTAERVSQLAAQSAQRSAKAATAAAQKAQAAAKATAAAAKAAAAATAKAIKAIIAAAEELASALLAGGSTALAVIVVVMLVGLLVGSGFGIFFGGQENETEIQKAIREINTAYEARLDALEGENPHDEVEMSGSRAPWKEVLAVYAVKVTSDPEDPKEVATMDEDKRALLEEVFWDMHELTFETETRTKPEWVETTDKDGNTTGEWSDVEKDYLLITVTPKTPEEMADFYGFDEDQRSQLAELLSGDLDELWQQVLYGVRTGDGDIVAVALTQVGNVGGDPYWSWYGFTSHVEWCACFVSWCANECGYIDAGTIPKFSGCVLGVQWFRERGQWLDNTAEPVPGAIIFFDWNNRGSSGPQDGSADHVGIVERVEDGRVYTIEGNSGNACRQRSYPIGHSEILGYGMPAY